MKLPFDFEEEQSAELPRKEWPAPNLRRGGRCATPSSCPLYSSDAAAD